MFTASANLVMALCLIEAGGNALAVNKKHGAYGPLQIRQMCLDDVNRYAATKYTLRQFVGNFSLSKWAFNTYATMYNARTDEEAVAIWHWGPTGAKRDHPGDDYVQRVMAMKARSDKEEGRK